MPESNHPKEKKRRVWFQLLLWALMKKHQGGVYTEQSCLPIVVKRQKAEKGSDQIPMWGTIPDHKLGSLILEDEFN